jgi:hypothetical protein
MLDGGYNLVANHILNGLQAMEDKRATATEDNEDLKPRKRTRYSEGDDSSGPTRVLNDSNSYALRQEFFRGRRVVRADGLCGMGAGPGVWGRLTVLPSFLLILHDLQ